MPTRPRLASCYLPVWCEKYFFVSLRTFWYTQFARPQSPREEGVVTLNSEFSLWQNLKVVVPVLSSAVA